LSLNVVLTVEVLDIGGFDRGALRIDVVWTVEVLDSGGV
jgi:hypothetical protein